MSVELPLADHVRGLDALKRSGCRMERFEAEHPPCDALDEAVILLKDIVQIFDLQDLDSLPGSDELEDHIHGFQPRQIGPTFVDNDTVGDTVRANCTPEETPRRRLVTPLR